MCPVYRSHTELLPSWSPVVRATVAPEAKCVTPTSDGGPELRKHFGHLRHHTRLAMRRALGRR